MKSSEFVMTSVRLPADLTDKIDRISLDERRSRSQQIVVLLERALELRGEEVPA